MNNANLYHRGSAREAIFDTLKKMNFENSKKKQDVENINFDVKQIEKDIDELLRISGISSDSVGTLAYEALRHQYMAASIFVKMDEAEQAVVGAEQKRLRNFFGVRCTLKSRKTRKSKRTSSPSPLTLEKENKEKVSENLSIVGRDAEAGFEGEATARTRKKRGRKSLKETLPLRKKAFLEECRAFGDKFDHEMINNFYNYWAQENRSGKKMLFEMQKTWNTAMRLKNWENRSYQYDNEAAKLRLERAKKGGAGRGGGGALNGGRVLGCSAAENSPEQKAIAAEREAADAKREAEMAEARKNSVSLEEYAKAHPDSLLAKMSAKK